MIFGVADVERPDEVDDAMAVEFGAEGFGERQRVDRVEIGELDVVALGLGLDDGRVESVDVVSDEGVGAAEFDEARQCLGDGGAVCHEAVVDSGEFRDLCGYGFAGVDELAVGAGYRTVADADGAELDDSRILVGQSGGFDVDACVVARQPVDGRSSGHGLRLAESDRLLGVDLSREVREQYGERDEEEDGQDCDQYAGILVVAEWRVYGGECEYRGEYPVEGAFAYCHGWSSFLLAFNVACYCLVLLRSASMNASRLPSMCLIK